MIECRISLAQTSDSIRVGGNLPLWAVLLLAVVVAVLCGALYLRETRRLSGPAAYALPALRAAAIAMTILTLAGPVWHHETVVGTLGRVVLALDASASMSIRDPGGGPDDDAGNQPGVPRRYDRVVDDLTRRQPGQSTSLLQQLRQQHNVEVATFDSRPLQFVTGIDVASGSDSRGAVRSATAQIADQLRGRPVDGNRTDLSVAINLQMAGQSTKVGRQIGADPPAAVVVLSDGCDNVDGNLPVATAVAGTGGPTIHTVGYGSVGAIPDIGIDYVEHPASVAEDGTLTATVGIKRVGTEGSCRVSVTCRDRTVWQKIIQPDGGSAVVVEMPASTLNDDDDTGNIGPDRRQPQIYELTATIESVDDSLPVGDEATDQNNRFDFRVARAERRRELLILDGSPRWEIRYLRNLFERDPTWSVSTVLFGPGTDMPSVVRGDGDGQLPNTPVAWNRFDAIVLGEVPPGQIDDADVEAIAEFVRRGGGLIVIDGRYGQLNKLAIRQSTDRRTLADLLPVRLSAAPPVRGTRIVPSPTALRRPAFQIDSGERDSARVWASLPPPRRVAVSSVKAGGEILASVQTDDGQSIPYIVTQNFGGGRVVYFAADQSWRWRLKVGDRYHSRFWTAMVAAVMQPPYAASDRFVAIGTDKIEYEPGVAPEIRVRLRDPAGDPVGDATVDAVIQRDGQTAVTVALVVDDPSRGTYRGQVDADRLGTGPGRYDVTVRSSGFDNRQLTASTSFWISADRSAEWRRLSRDESTLRNLAAAGNGRYLPRQSIDQLPSLLRPVSSGTRVVTDVAVWQTWWWLATILLLLTAEWLLRKVAGLV